MSKVKRLMIHRAVAPPELQPEHVFEKVDGETVKPRVLFRGEIISGADLAKIDADRIADYIESGIASDADDPEATRAASNRLSAEFASAAAAADGDDD